MSQDSEILTIFAKFFDEINKLLWDLESELRNHFKNNSLTVDSAAELVKSIYFIKNNLAVVYEFSTHVLAELMEDLPEIQLGDGTKIEKKTASDRRSWNHKNIATEIARRINMSNVDMETGELMLSAEEMMVEMLRFLQPSYWRVKELSTIGINADNYCEVLEPKTSIIVRKPKT